MRFMTAEDWSWRYDLIFPSLAKLPRHLAYQLAGWQALWMARCQAQKATCLDTEMARVFPEASVAQRRLWIKDHFRMVEQEALDTWLLDTLGLQQQVQLQGFEAVQQARASGRRVILTGGHFGRFWLAGPAMRLQGQTTGTITRDGAEENPHGLHPAEHRFRLFKLKRLAQALGGPFLIEGEDLRGLYRALDQSLIALIFDVPYFGAHQGGVTVPFLGGKIYVPAGVYRISKNTGSLVAPFYVRDLGAGRVLVEFSSLLEPHYYNKEDFMSLLAAQLEQYIQKQPGHWWLWEALPQMRR